MKTHSHILIQIALYIAIATSGHAQPVLDWSRLYNGGSSFTDKVATIAVDNNCHTYITGESDSIGQGIDIVTIKYDMDGNIIWKNRWDGGDHLDDIPTDMRVDQSGNVYVCGRTQGVNSSFNFVTIKYTSSGAMASGLWPAIYNNNNANGNGYDGAKSLCVNNTTGDVYVAGESFNHYSSVSLEDIFVIRYDGQGNILDTASGVDVHNRDYVREIGFDFSGKLFLLTYDSFGSLITYWYNSTLSNGNNWNTHYGITHIPTNFGIDLLNNKYYGMDQSNGFSLVKLDPNNFNVWQKTYRKTATTTDEVKSVVTDNSGTTYVVAATTNTSGESDVWFLKVNTNGDTIWTRTWGAGNGTNDVPVKIMGISSPLGLVVVGNTINGGVSTIVTLRFDTAGNLQNNYPLLFNTATDVATDATKDSYGNLFVGGYSGSAGSEDFLTLKYRMNSYAVQLGTVNGDSLYVSPAASTYQWYKDGIMLVNETNRGINIDTPLYGNGNYFCQITQYCSTYYSDTLTITTVGMHTATDSQDIFSILSSSNKNHVEILFNSSISEGQLKVYDALGHEIVSEKIRDVSAGTKKEIALKNYSGMYMLMLSNKSSVTVKKFLVVN